MHTQTPWLCAGAARCPAHGGARERAPRPRPLRGQRHLLRRAPPLRPRRQPILVPLADGPGLRVAQRGEKQKRASQGIWERRRHLRAATVCHSSAAPAPFNRCREHWEDPADCPKAVFNRVCKPAKLNAYINERLNAANGRFVGALSQIRSIEGPVGEALKGTSQEVGEDCHWLPQWMVCPLPARVVFADL